MSEEKEHSTAPIIIKKKIHKGHGGHSSSWKIAFADFAVAMMAFFLLMWIITSTSEAEKESISGYFQNPEAPISGTAPLQIIKMKPLTNREETSSNEVGKSALENFLAEEQAKTSDSETNIPGIINDLEESVHSGLLEIEVRSDRIIIRLLENSSFPSGSTELCPGFLPILKKIAKVLQLSPGKVIVAGYTDDIPINTALFRSNRELSAIRAVSVAEELLKDNKIKPERFVIQGNGENNPIASNDTIAGKNKNRRVEIEMLQGEEPKSKSKVITVEKDADTKLLPNVEKGIEEDSVFPPITDINFDGDANYLEKGELGVFDKDVLYNYEINDKVTPPKEDTKDDTKPDVTEEIKKPDDLGIFKAKEGEAKPQEKSPGDLGVFKEEPEKTKQPAKTNAANDKIEKNDTTTDKQSSNGDLGLFKEEKIEPIQSKETNTASPAKVDGDKSTPKKPTSNNATTKNNTKQETETKKASSAKIDKSKTPAKLPNSDDLGIVQKSTPIEQPKTPDGDLGVFHEQDNNKTGPAAADDLGLYKEPENAKKPEKTPDDLGVIRSQESKDPNDLGIIKHPPAKKATEIKIDKDAKNSK